MEQIKQFDLGLRCLSRLFLQATSVRNLRTFTVLIKYILWLTNWFICSNEGASMCNLSAAILFKAVLSNTT